MFLPALFTVVKTRKHPKCSSTDEWIKKRRYHGIFLSHKQDETMPFAATWMDRDDPIKWVKSEKDKQHVISLMLLLLLSHFSRVRLCATPQTAAHQAPPSLGFSRQEHWSGLPFPVPSLIHGTKENDTNELIYKAEIDSLTQKTNLRLPKGKGRGIYLEFWINRYKLPYIK